MASSSPPLELGNKQVVLRHYVEGTPTVADMEVRSSKVDVLAVLPGSGGILLKNLYLSCDSYMQGRMRDFHGSNIPPFTPGSVIEGFGVSRVIDSDNPNFKVGDLVSGTTSWEEYSLNSLLPNFEQPKKIQMIDGIPLSYHAGLLGVTGFAAYFGLFEVHSPKKGDSIFVSAASGVAGQLVGQLAKLRGCYVVGSASTEQKVEILKNKLGFDEAFNYKVETDYSAALKRYFPDGMDFYFDNVGGAMLDAVLLNMKPDGRIAACGMVSLAALSHPKGFHRMFSSIAKHVGMQAFSSSHVDHVDLYLKFLDLVTDHYKQGKIVYIEDVSEGIDDAPAALAALFSGRKVGKQVVSVSRE